MSPNLGQNLYKAVSHKFTRNGHPVLWGRAVLRAGQELMKGDLCAPLGGILYQAAITGRLELPPQAACISDVFDEAAQLVGLSGEVLTFEASILPKNCGPTRPASKPRITSATRSSISVNPLPLCIFIL